MNLKIAVFLFLSQFVFAQSEKRIKGTVLYNNTPMAEVDVVNIQSRNSTQTNRSGEFEIAFAIGDTLVFISKDYQLRRIKLTEKKISESPFIIELYLKPEELKEVIVVNKPSSTLDYNSDYEFRKRNELDIEKMSRTLKNQFVYDGQTVGIDFIKLAGQVKQILGIHKKKKEKQAETIPFSKQILQNYPLETLSKTLNIHPDQFRLFLDFCEADPKSHAINPNNQLAVLDFLLKKKAEFQKLR